MGLRGKFGLRVAGDGEKSRQGQGVSAGRWEAARRNVAKGGRVLLFICLCYILDVVRGREEVMEEDW